MSRKNNPDLFEFGPFTVTPKGLTNVAGRPGMDEWAQAGRRIVAARSSLQWAIGDWLLFGDGRYEEDAYETAAEATGLRRGTLSNLKAVAKAFPIDKRDPEVGWSHHALLAGFDDEVRERLMQETKKNKLSWEELRTHCKTLRQAVRQAMQSWPEGTFGVMLATPQWRVSESPEPDTISADDIAALAPHIQRIASPDCVLYMLVPSGRLLDGDVQTVLRAWGFTGKGLYAWVRDIIEHTNPWLSERHWHVVVATRGNPVAPNEELLADSVQEHDVPGSDVLPAEMIRIIERLHPDAPKVELFAAKARFGWSAWGEKLNEASQTSHPSRRAVRLRDQERETVAATR